MNLLRKKNIQDMLTANEKSQLKRELTTFDLLFLGIGAIIGVGLFIRTSEAAMCAGAGVSLSFIIAGIACVLSALSFAEFAALVPVAGSVYTYTYVTVGEFFAWLIGGMLTVEFLVGSSAVAVGWSRNLQEFLGENMPLSGRFLAAPGVRPDTLFDLPAFLIMLLVTFLLFRGVTLSKQANNIMATIKVGLILFFILACCSFINADNWQPFIPVETGWSGIFSGSAIVFYAFIGFDKVISAAEECKNPTRDLPRGILLSLAISTIVYIAFALVATGVVPCHLFNKQQTAILTVTTFINQNWISRFITAGLVLGMAAGVLVNLYCQIRLTYAMARDGLLPKALTNIHSKYFTPGITTWSVGIVAALLAGFVPLTTLADCICLATLVAFAFVSLCVLILRKKNPDLHRPFTCPCFPWIPIGSILINLFLMFNVGWQSWLLLFIWVIITTIIYFVYARSRSNLAH